MKDSVRAGARAFTAGFESIKPCMYADNRDLVTCAIGNLVDPLGAALALPWVRRRDGVLATPAEVAAEWHLVKDGKLWASPQRCATSDLILTPEAIDSLFFSKLDQNEVYLARRFARWNDWSADAQLGAHSCAWAAGAAWQAPHFDADAGQVSASGFHAAAGMPGTDGNDPLTRGSAWLRDTRPEDDAAGIHKPTLNPGLRPRNLANQWLFQNAAVVLADGIDPQALYWPTQLNG